MTRRALATVEELIQQCNICITAEEMLPHAELSGYFVYDIDCTNIRKYGAIDKILPDLWLCQNMPRVDTMNSISRPYNSSSTYHYRIPALNKSLPRDVNIFDDYRRGGMLVVERLVSPLLSNSRAMPTPIPVKLHGRTGYEYKREGKWCALVDWAIIWPEKKEIARYLKAISDRPNYIFDEEMVAACPKQHIFVLNECRNELSGEDCIHYVGMAPPNLINGETPSPFNRCVCSFNALSLKMVKKLLAEDPHLVFSPVYLAEAGQTSLIYDTYSSYNMEFKDPLPAVRSFAERWQAYSAAAAAADPE